MRIGKGKDLIFIKSSRELESNHAPGRGRTAARKPLLSTNVYARPPASAAGSELRPEGRASRRRRRHTISDDDRGSPQTPGAGSAVGLGRRSVGLEPHESPTTPPHRRDGRTRCRPMQAAASTAPAILAAARRHAPARKRGCRQRSRAACVVIRAAPGPLFDVTAAPGAGRCAPDPRPLSHPPDPPARRPLHCAPARAPIAKSRLSSAVRAPHTSRERRRVCGRAVPCTSRRHRAENPAHSAPTEAAGGRWPIATIVTKCSFTGSSPSCLGWYGLGVASRRPSLLEMSTLFIYLRKTNTQH